MQRYVAFSWPDGSEAATSRATFCSEALDRSEVWTPALRRTGLQVWTACGQRLPVRELTPGGVVVIGDIFDRRGGCPTVCVPGLPAQPEAAARRLAADTWGAFVAILPDPSDDDVWVYREPSGFLDVFCWSLGPLTVVADDLISLPQALRPDRAALDWDVITHIAKRPLGVPHRSPLAGVTPVAPGDVRPLRDLALPPVAIWRPASWAGRASDLDPADLRAAVLGTVSAMAAVEPRIALEVSGGLDSAIVAAALVETGHRDRVGGVLNYFSARAAGDERAWAMAVCESKGLPLDAIAQQVGVLTDADFSELAPHIGPAFGGVDVHYDRDVGARASALGATAIFGGQGGDAVFFQMPTTAVAADYLATTSRLGIADPLVIDVARWLRRSIWSVLGEARSGRSWIGVDHALTPQFWGPRARALADAEPHPWLSDLEAVPPGKQIQIQAILGSQANWGRSRRAGAARVVNPLLAQPILEICLAAPSWRLVAGVRDRGLARMAFAPLLPEAVVQRRSKGALNALFSQRAAASLEFLRPHLLDGVLMSAGVLDHAAVERALQPDTLIWRAEGGRLTRVALLESWLRYWQTRVPDVAATGRASRD